MTRYRLDIEYDGRPFQGWQRQADQPSVQGAVEAALARLRGSALLERRRIDLTRNLERHTTLEAQVPRLQTAGPFLRSYYLLRAPDAEALRATVQKFSPTAPRSRAELIFATIGFIVGAAFARLLLWLPTWSARFRRRRALRS